ncbi:septum site-determining protein MinC [Lacticigenium naphthae]|uniref:septum site-determining protein MinC n=1 Tax=Lacticigenium naphthae TaxID=515351 RepID=UPI0003F68380|nr:septum site-determining protein MinC [Lacticigenium naphthae]
MAQKILLKGVKDGYQIHLQDSGSYDELMEELAELIQGIKKDSQSFSNKHKEIQVLVKTGKRLFEESEKIKIRETIEEIPLFKVKAITSDVIEIEKAEMWQKEVSLILEIATVRSGQIIEASGDILLIGNINPGGMIRSKGNIFIIGELQGIAHAGFEGNDQAVVVSNFAHKSQVRIADHIHVMEENSEENEENQSSTKFSYKAAYMNDLHILDFEPVNGLKKVRPQLGNLSRRLYENG